MRNLRYNVIFREEPEGGFTVVIPYLPGCVTYGKTLREAKIMVLDAITGYLERLRRHNEPIPNDEGSFLTLIDLPSSSLKQLFLIILKI